MRRWPLTLVVLLLGTLTFTGAAMAEVWSEAAANAPLQRGDRAAAVEYAQNWTRAEPQNPVAWARLGLAQDQALNDPRAAVISLKKAVTLDPNYVRAWNALGMIDRKLGDTVGSEDAMRHTVQTTHGRASYWHLQVVDLSSSRRYGAAIDAAGKYEQAIAGSTDPQEWYVLGNDYSGLREWQRGIGAYQHAIQLNPNIGDVWNNMGVAEQYLGQNATASNDYKKAAALGNSAAAANERSLIADSQPRQPTWSGPGDMASKIRAVQEKENLGNCGHYTC
jgi:tetratricopeptide (TPR) repeat protein